MDAHRVETLLEEVREGRKSVGDGLQELARLPLVDLGHTRVDTHRALRCGAGEVVFGEGKTPAELVEIAHAILADQDRLLVTRTHPEGRRALVEGVEGAVAHDRSRSVTVGLPREDEGAGLCLVVSAGTSDGAVAEEAELAARMAGVRVERLSDVGVAGIHRLLEHVDRLRSATCLVVVAGMEGALPSVVGGLVDRPVVAVPTSVGYGTGLGGFAAMLAMLNSCAAGVTVVNVDNGFGAGCAAARIVRSSGVVAE